MALLGLRKLLTGAIAAGLMLSFGAGTAHAEKWRIATLAPPGSVWMKILNEGAAHLEKDTQGRVGIKYYAGGVQGDERDVIRKMRLGQLDGGAMTSVGLSMISQSVRVIELPRMFNSRREMAYARARMWGTFRRRFLKKGFELGDPGEVGPISFYSKKKITALGQLRGHKVWMWTDDKLVREIYKFLNIRGIPLGVPEVQPALAGGKIDAFYTSPVAAVSLQWYSKVKFVTSMPLSYAISASVITTKAWDRISDADKKTQRALAKKYGKKLRKNVRRQTRKARAAMSSSVTTVETPAAMVAEFDAAAQKVWCSLIGSVYSKRDLQRVLKYRDEYRKKKGQPAGPVPKCAQ